MLKVKQSNPPLKPTPVEQNKLAAMRGALQPATNQPKPPTTQPTDRAGEKTTP